MGTKDGKKRPWLTSYKLGRRLPGTFLGPFPTSSSESGEVSWDAFLMPGEPHRHPRSHAAALPTLSVNFKATQGEGAGEGWPEGWPRDHSLRSRDGSMLFLFLPKSFLLQPGNHH